MLNSIPLAWKNLIHDKRKLFIAISGIAFASLLMFQQRGFNDALFDSTVAVLHDLDADLIVSSPLRFSLSNEIRFPRSLLDVIASHPSVETVEPLFFENVTARIRCDGNRARPIRVLAFDLNRHVLLDSNHEIYPQLTKLREPDTALLDRLSKNHYGFDLSSTAVFPQKCELNGKKLSIVGSFQIGRDFSQDGNLLMSQEAFATYFPYRAPDPLSVIDVAIVRLRKGARSENAIRSIQSSLGVQANVTSRQEYIDKEIRFWSRNTPIGVIFTIGTIMGFVVGVIICYQILANEISEHMGEFATLKAMGYTNRYFFSLVIFQSIYLAILGFIPGLFVTWILFEFNSSVTGLIMELSLPRILLILFATLTMCICSGLLAIRKLIAADPASLF